MSEETTEEVSKTVDVVDPVEECPFSAGDRVLRKDDEMSAGVVLEVRSEVTAKTGASSEIGLLVVVQWDSGTTSYFTPNSLVKA